MVKPRCENCMYCNEIEKNIDERNRIVLQCRRHPPIKIGLDYHSFFIRVEPGWWCGEFKEIR